MSKAGGIIEFVKKSAWAQSFGLAHRLTAVLTLVIVLCIAAMLAISVHMQKCMIEDRLNVSAMHLASLVKEISIPALLRNDPAALELFFEELEARPDILSVSIIDPQGYVWMSGGSEVEAFLAPVDDAFVLQAIALDQPQQALKADYLHRAGPIEVGGQIIGFLNLRLSRAPIETELRRLWISTVGIGLACLICGPIVAWQIARRLSEPLMNLAKASRRVADGDFDHRITSVSKDEFQLVASSFNNMLDELQRSLLETKRVAYEDRLTQIPNRSWLNIQIDNLTASTGEDQQFAILFLDVDRFKEVNDTHGHHVGDQLLRAFVRRVDGCLRQLGLAPQSVEIEREKPLALAEGQALLARLGGDEFTVIVGTKVARTLADAIAKKMAQPFVINGLQLAASASLGIALCPDHATSREHLLKCADVAMYQAKNKGRATFAFYDHRTHRSLVARSQMEKDLERAIAEDEFSVFFQPKFTAESDVVFGAEALVRWDHPTKGRMRPDLFLPMASKLGLMPQIGQLMLSKTMQVAKQVNAERDQPLSFAVNTASEELLDGHFCERVERNLDHHGIAPQWLEIEITEGTAMDHNDLVEHNIDRLRELGVRLAIDDFGVGYSNLGRLKTMQFDTLKIDRSLVADVVSDMSARTLMRAVVDMASLLGAETLAEGVEQPDQLAFLRGIGIKAYQGYWGAKPMSAHDFLTWVKTRPLNQRKPVPRVPLQIAS